MMDVCITGKNIVLKLPTKILYLWGKTYEVEAVR